MVISWLDIYIFYFRSSLEICRMVNNIWSRMYVPGYPLPGRVEFWCTKGVHNFFWPRAIKPRNKALEECEWVSRRGEGRHISLGETSGWGACVFCCTEGAPLLVDPRTPAFLRLWPGLAKYVFSVYSRFIFSSLFDVQYTPPAEMQQFQQSACVIRSESVARAVRSYGRPKRSVSSVRSAAWIGVMRLLWLDQVCSLPFLACSKRVVVPPHSLPNERRDRGAMLIDLWRESMEHQRQLQGGSWNILNIQWAWITSTNIALLLLLCWACANFPIGANHCTRNLLLSGRRIRLAWHGDLYWPRQPAWGCRRVRAAHVPDRRIRLYSLQVCRPSSAAWRNFAHLCFGPWEQPWPS